MSTARLEMIIEETNAKSVSYLGEIGRKAAEIHQLKSELGKEETLSLPQRVRMALVRGLTQGQQQSDAA
jgi:hypothetical protein